MFLSSFGTRMIIGLIEWIRKIFHLLIFSFLEEFEYLCWFFFKHLVEFSSKAIWPWGFLCWKIFDYWFSLLLCLFRFSISSWVSFGSCMFLKNLFISHNLLAYNCSQHSFKLTFIPARLIVLYFLSFLVIWVLSFFSCHKQLFC